MSGQQISSEDSDEKGRRLASDIQLHSIFSFNLGASYICMNAM